MRWLDYLLAWVQSRHTMAAVATEAREMARLAEARRQTQIDLLDSVERRNEDLVERLKDAEHQIEDLEGKMSVRETEIELLSGALNRELQRLEMETAIMTARRVRAAVSEVEREPEDFTT